MVLLVVVVQVWVWVVLGYLPSAIMAETVEVGHRMLGAEVVAHPHLGLQVLEQPLAQEEMELHHQ
jgi:hypothetical protein